jgi:hypothetical protein
MPYFSYFPSISYTMDKNDLTKVQIVKDVTVRAKISDYFKNAAITSLPYEIQDGERPETLAHRIYDRSDLHWLVLMFNEVHDPTFEWPLSSAELESYISEKYKGYTIYYPDTARIPDTFQLQNTLVLSGAKTLHQNLADGSTISADIIKWEPTYNSIIIDGEQASLFDPAYDYPFSEDAYARCYVDNDPTKILAFSRVQPRQFSVHHFEDADGNVLDPRSGPPSDTLNASSILNRYVTQTGFVDVIGVDNRTYEFGKNDEKRLIRVVKPEFISAILTQFRSIFT